MTAPQATDLVAFLDRLEETHNAATPGEWEVLPGEGIWWGESEGTDYGTFITMDVDDAHAAAIVDAHNHQPALIAALRGVLAKCDTLEAAAPIGRFFAEEFRGVVTAALGAIGGER